MIAAKKPILLFVINEAFFFLSHRKELAMAASQDFEVHIAAPPDHVWAPAGFDISEITRLGITWHDLPLSRRGQKPWEEIRTIFVLACIIRKLRPTILHLLTIKPNLYGGVLARLLGVPGVVFGITGLGQIFVAAGFFARVRRALSKALLSFAFSHPHAMVTVQNAHDLAVVRTLVSQGDRALLLLRGSGVDLSRFQFAPEQPGVPLAILAARLIWEKGVGEFAAAARILNDRGVALRFALVGDTQESNPRAVPPATLRSWEPLVEWWGRRDDMPAIMAAAHIVCLPSTYGEGVPKVLIEAAASGRPIVATDIPGCREIVVDGKTGFLVPPGNPEALAHALERLARNAPLRHEQGLAARQMAEAEFDVRSVVKKTLGAYAALLHAADRRKPHL